MVAGGLPYRERQIKSDTAQWLNVVGTPCNNYFRKFPQKLTYSTIFLRFQFNFLHCQNLRAFTRTRTLGAINANSSPLNAVILKIHENLPMKNEKIPIKNLSN